MSEPAVRQARPHHELPYAAWWPALAGALTGVVLRLAFMGGPGGIYAAMGFGFIYFVPVAVGAVTVYVAERHRRRSWGYYIWAPVSANILFVAGAVLMLLEGFICAFIAVPLFAALGAVGGLVMGGICRVTRWPRHAAYALAVAPLIVGAWPDADAGSERIRSVERTVVIAAPAAAIWWQIHHTQDIRPEEVRRAWIYRIGVPMPQSGLTRQTSEGRVRRITMGKGVHFDQIAAEWRENERVRWTYRFDADSFPAGALDDHVRIGGRYFDLLDTSYTLTPIDARATRVRLDIRYRVSTRFNWYADPVARLLIGNVEDVLLDFHRRRVAAGGPV